MKAYTSVVGPVPFQAFEVKLLMESQEDVTVLQFLCAHVQKHFGAYSNGFDVAAKITSALETHRASHN